MADDVNSKKHVNYKDNNILPSILIEDYQKVMGKDINHFTDGTKIHVTIVLTKEIMEAYNTIPELKLKLSKRARFLLAQDLVNNGYGTESAEEKLRLINRMSKDLENSKMILTEHIAKQREAELIKSRQKAEALKTQDQLIEFIANNAIEYKQMLKTRLNREVPEVAKNQILDLIETRLKQEVKRIFGREMDADKLFELMELDKVK